MNPRILSRAVLVGFVVFAGTLLLSIPMVLVYSVVIAPGHPPEYYRTAATWIAPWASHIGGPLLFFWLNHRLTARHPETAPVAFAWSTIGSYVVIDLASVPIFGLQYAAVVTPVFVVSLAVKAVAAIAGAVISARRTGATRMPTAMRS